MLTGGLDNGSAALACALAKEVVRTLGEVRLRTAGTSMVPSIIPGDVVSIQRASLQDISPGEIVVFLQKGQIVVHRVVDRKTADAAGRPVEPCLITRGDRLRHHDPPVSAPELVGRVVSIRRDDRKVEPLADEWNHMVACLLRSSDRVTYLYLRLAACRQTFSNRRAKCPV